MGEERLFHLPRNDVVTTADDQILDPTGDPEEPVRIEVAEVAAAQPSAAPGLSGGHFLLEIPARRLGTPNGDLPHLPRGNRISLVIHHSDLDTGQWPAGRAPMA